MMVVMVIGGGEGDEGLASLGPLPGAGRPLSVRSRRSALVTEADADDRERRETLEVLHREHYRSLVRLASLLVDQHEVAEEIVQEAFVRLHGSFDRVRTPDDRPAYLRSIVMNLARSRLRRRRVVRRHPPTPEPPAAGADVMASLREDHREVIDALRVLPTRQRECLVLRYYQNCSEAEIATALGISTGAVKSHVSRAKAAMAITLEGRR